MMQGTPIHSKIYQQCWFEGSGAHSPFPTLISEAASGWVRVVRTSGSFYKKPLDLIFHTLRALTRIMNRQLYEWCLKQPHIYDSLGLRSSRNGNSRFKFHANLTPPPVSSAHKTLEFSLHHGNTPASAIGILCFLSILSLSPNLSISIIFGKVLLHFCPPTVPSQLRVACLATWAPPWRVRFLLNFVCTPTSFGLLYSTFCKFTSSQLLFWASSPNKLVWIASHLINLQGLLCSPLSNLTVLRCCSLRRGFPNQLGTKLISNHRKLNILKGLGFFSFIRDQPIHELTSGNFTFAYLSVY